MDIEVTRAALATLRAAASVAHPREACGLLLGEGVRITAARAAANVHPAPATHFEIDPAALIAAHRGAREGTGPQVLGYFHSHPRGPAEPSATDRELRARDGRIWAIIAGDDVTFWRDGGEGFAPLSFACRDS